VFEFVLLGRARAQYEALDPDERADADRVIRLLEMNPWIDGVIKAEILVAPLVLSAFNDGRWRMIYRVVNGRFIEIFAITRVR
jgi:hypothetical protein